MIKNPVSLEIAIFPFLTFLLVGTVRATIIVDDAVVGHSGGPVCQSLLPAHLWVETRGAGSFCYND